MMGDDSLHLIDDVDDEKVASKRKWVVLVVDDDKIVHGVTELALHDFEFAGRSLELISAYSGSEAKKIMSERDDVAMLLLDVVMESDTAGLEVVQYIRETLKNQFVRIVLRTGQPGQAPEYKVITNYDINDYKEKTELTRQKLFTCVYTSLSSYRDLVALDTHRKGLLKVIEATADLFNFESMDQFAQGVMEQISALMYLDQDLIFVRSSGLSVEKSNDHIEIVAATGKYSSLAPHGDAGLLDEITSDRLNQAFESGENRYGPDYFVGYYRPEKDVSHLLYVSGEAPMSELDFALVELFTRNVSIAHEKMLLLLKNRG